MDSRITSRKKVAFDLLDRTDTSSLPVLFGYSAAQLLGDKDEQL
jgi:hypothetical protein